MGNLQSLEYSILDVSMATRWHDDYNEFNNGVKDLEMMLSNVIALAFDSSSSLLARMDLLETFHALAKRDFIMRTIEKEIDELCRSLHHEFAKCTPNKPGQAQKADPMMPRYAGQAMWALSLRRRMAKPMERFNELVPRLIGENKYGSKSLVEQSIQSVQYQYEKALQQIDVYVDKHHAEWSVTIGDNLRRGLELNLIQREEGSEDGLLSVNFDKSILEMFQEVFFWERLHKDIPYEAMMINAGREKLRILHENVLLVVRDYNRIITALDDPSRRKEGGQKGTREASERQLFHDRLKYLDRRILPGIERLTWISDKSVLDTYVREARRYCCEVWSIVEQWQTARRHIAVRCWRGLFCDKRIFAVRRPRQRHALLCRSHVP